LEIVHQLIELSEDQLRELVNAQSTWTAFSEARREALQVKGSMIWKRSGNGTYLVRTTTAGAQTSLGAQDERTQRIYDAFHERKGPAEARLKSLKGRLEEQRKLNRVYRVGRAPNVVVRALAALDAADMADKFMVIGTHAIHAYETAAGVRVESAAMATRDLDLLFDVRKRLAFATTLERTGARSFIGVLRKADASFRVMRDQLQTAVNDDGFEIDIEIADGDKMVTGRKFEQLVVATSGEMAVMRTLHPLDFIRIKRGLAELPDRDPQKAPKDRLQAEVVQQLWDEYLYRRERARE